MYLFDIQIKFYWYVDVKVINLVEGIKRVIEGTTTLEELNSKLLFY